MITRETVYYNAIKKCHKALIQWIASDASDRETVDKLMEILDDSELVATMNCAELEEVWKESTH